MNAIAIRMVQFETREEWLEHRKSHLGGSEISAVVGYNPYMNNQRLWELKTGRATAVDISDKPFVKYGNDAEYHLRELFRLDFPEYKVEYVENNSWINDKYPWAAASLDGWLTDQRGRKGILEIKTTEIINSMSKEKWKDGVPNNYFCQVLFYMAVYEAEFCVLKAQLKSVLDGIPYLQTKHYIIERTEVQEDIDYLMQEGEKFWKHVKEDTHPDLMLPTI